MWEVFKDWIFYVIQFFYNFSGDWGVAIIIVTLIFRLLVAPLMHKSARSNYQMQKIQPMIAAVQQKYANDQIRAGQEMQRIYAEAKYNPLSGCLPVLLQMPIFAALFQVLREMGDRVGDSNYSFYNLVPNLVMSPSQAIGYGFGTFVPYLVLMIVFAGATFAPMVIMQATNKNSPQRTQVLIMAAVMSVVMLWISWGSPAGVLLFWGTSSLIGVFQNQLSMYIFKRADREAEAQAAEAALQPVDLNVKRKVKKPRPTKKH